MLLYADAIPRWPAGCSWCDPYTKGEWRSGISLAGATDVLIEGLTVMETGVSRLDSAATANLGTLLPECALRFFTQISLLLSLFSC